MKLIFIILFFSFSSFAQEEKNGTVDTENPSNYKSDLIKEIVSIPVQTVDNKTLMSWDKSLLQLGYGQSFFRFDPNDGNDKSISTFSDKGHDLNLRAQYYLFSFFSMLIDYEFTTFETERFDGQSIQQKNRMSRSLGYGLQFDLGDFIIGMIMNQWNKPFYSLANSQFIEDEYKANVYTYKLGHRTGIKNFILEIFYYYHDIQPFEVSYTGKTSGRIQTIGIELFTNNKRTFGLHFSESFGTLDSDTGFMEVKQLKIQPFYRF